MGRVMKANFTCLPPRHLIFVTQATPDVQGAAGTKGTRFSWGAPAAGSRRGWSGRSVEDGRGQAAFLPQSHMVLLSG